MNKMNGKRGDFSYMKEDGSRMVVGYGLKELENGLWEWYEVYLNKKQVNQVTLQVVKDAILADINTHTDEKILKGFVWNNIHVWLSAENQFNFKAAYDLALQTQGQSLPVTFKIGEQEDETPIYHTFSDMEDFTGFYTTVFGYINRCLNEGWQRKDSIDWESYKALFPEVEPIPSEQ